MAAVARRAKSATVEVRPPPDLPSLAEWRSQLAEVAARDGAMARRAALLRLLWQESHFTREGLIARVEALLGRGCFGSEALQALRRDLHVVRAAVAQRGFRLRYSRTAERQGYYVEGRPPLDEHLSRLIAGSAAEVDPRQVAILGRLQPSERFHQGRSMTEFAEKVGAYRRGRQPRQREPTPCLAVGVRQNGAHLE